MPLFSKTLTIYDDSFKSQPGERQTFPFEIYFPENIESSSDYDFGFFPENALPPSFLDNNFGFQCWYESFVEYRVGVSVIMQGLKINVSKPEKYEQPVVRYERPRLHQPFEDKRLQLNGIVSITNELLLAEEDRPSGFKQKAKGKAMAVFSSGYYPKYTFDWKCFGPRHLYSGHPATFQVHITPRENECTAVAIPEIYLTAFTVAVKAATAVRAERRFLTTPESRGQCTIATLMGMIDDTGPFSKSNDWTKSVVTEHITEVPSSFRTVNISRSYSIQVRLVFKLTGKYRDFGESYQVFIHPPLQVADSEAAVASSSARPMAEGEMGDPGSTLPQYERPPEYDEGNERV